ncbi:hypothetical protein [Streptomyces sp. H34-S4]|uniref:hypothetical protein n=1 Tax=Streptomyces sp. H34-S4 TaxID=2996463 RepID=UPI00226E1028|nr:hypothetical protein [Streptomyces sp. H34-S4]MCY0935983.1 hypothetical protein [Streptomyces sp. H34-S4]
MRQDLPGAVSPGRLLDPDGDAQIVGVRLPRGNDDQRVTGEGEVTALFEDAERGSGQRLGKTEMGAEEPGCPRSRRPARHRRRGAAQVAA